MQHQVGNELITCVEMDSLVRVTMVPCSRMYKDAAHVMLMWTAGSFSRQSFGLGCAVNSSRGDRGIRHVPQFCPGAASTESKKPRMESIQRRSWYLAVGVFVEEFVASGLQWSKE